MGMISEGEMVLDRLSKIERSSLWSVLVIGSLFACL